MNTVSSSGGDILKDDAPPSNTSASGRAKNGSETSVATSTSSVSINLEGTSILTTAYSRGYMAHNYVGKELVTNVAVSGVEMNAVGFLTYDAKLLQTYSVKRVVSPFEFYLEREIETKCEESLRDEKMQEFYEEEEKQAFEYSITVSKMKCYAYYDRNSKTWSRVRVLDFESDAKGGLNRAYAYYCDTGKQEFILCEDLRNLPEQFHGVRGTVVLKCYLYDVLPISGDMHWSIKSMIFFNEWMEKQRLGAIVMKWTKKPVVEHSPDFTFDCGVVLMEKLDPSEIPDTINRRLVGLGYARSIGLFSCSSKDLEIPGFVPRFNKSGVPKTKALQHQPKNSTVDTVVFDQTPLPLLRRIVASNMPDQRPIDRNYVYYVNENVQPKKSNVQIKFPTEMRQLLAVVKMSFVEGPDKIFVHTVNKKSDLKDMEKEIWEGFHIEGESTLPKPSLQDLQPGSVILCHMINHVKPKLQDYCRAFVLEVDLTKKAAKVILVDYGNILLVHHKLIYELPSKYHSIPSFVHGIHLRDIRPSYMGLKWDQPIRALFCKYILSYEREYPKYVAHIDDKEDAVQLVDLDQRIVFNERESKWRAENSSHSGDAFVTSMRNNPLLASHFYSHAVDLMYETHVKESEFWEFKHLSHCLLEKGHAKLVEPKVDKNKIHEIISNGFGFL